MSGFGLQAVKHRRESACNISSEINCYDRAVPIGECGAVSYGLSRDEIVECRISFGDGERRRWLVGDLQIHATCGPTLVKLSCRVKEPRSEADGHMGARLCRQSRSQLGKAGNVLCRLGDVGLNRHVRGLWVIECCNEFGDPARVGGLR